MSRVLPILFNTDMVRAILDGRKTVTRRVAKKIPAETHRIEPMQPFDGGALKFECHWGGYMPDVQGFKDGMAVVKPPYQPGDILYVRETWQYIGFAGEDNGYVYKAPENGKLWQEETEGWKWRPSIHMPKEAARIWLKVTDVRAERLQDISDEQLRKEGFIPEVQGHFKFKWTWNSTLKKSDIDRYGWDANPWVWVIGFERCEKPSEST